jgi:TonB family protein
MTAAEFADRFDYDPDNDLLGEGGFGKIFKAWDNVRNEFIALKMSKVQPNMEEFSLLSEYERVRHLEHPNIARYMDCQRIKLPGIGTHDIALMKHYEHGNLSQLLSKHTLTQAQKQKIIDGLLEGIGYLHKLRPLIIHSDLKPSNILIVERRGFFIPLITDFGISRQAKVDDKSYVTNTVGAGTYAYAAPEQWEAKELRPNADLWSFAIMAIYVWFNGKKLPFRSDDISIATESGRIEYMKRVIALDFIPDLRELPDNYRRMIDACLVINPQTRVRSVDELYARIKSAVVEDAAVEEVTQILPKIPKAVNPHLVAIDEQTSILPKEKVAVPDRRYEPKKEEIRPEILPSKPKFSMIFWVAASVLALVSIGGGIAWYTRQPEPIEKAEPVASSKALVKPVVKDTVKTISPPPKEEVTPEKPMREKIKKEPMPEKVKEVDNKSIYHVVEELPRFPGGNSALNTWLATHLRTPEAAERSFISGVVRLSFIVNTDGTRQDVQVVKKLGYGCDEEAVRLVKSMPNWIPGRTSGRTVRVRHTMGITFE